MSNEIYIIDNTANNIYYNTQVGKNKWENLFVTSDITYANPTEYHLWMLSRRKK